ncbi:DUF6412 domain-containing protein [Amnibacterium setariae]|uniref:Uncharacterized protein n=1 Tax=Amnibacterium setariae TaxID=2306585 RepID=A0A3A1UDG1_9MICO|nr:DUF6412 domain-containing protein [Amnibacterium setariae]RIX31156.1 hypothetical protein D1781_07285 [Amnibacterium setariae]
MIAGLLSAFVVLVQPDAVGAEALLAAGLLTAVLAVAVVLRTLRAPRAVLAAAAADGFADVRVLLRSSDPDAEGHPRARAPGATR